MKKKRDTYSSISSHSYQTISIMTSLKNNHTWHFRAMQSLDSLAETTAVVRLLHAIIMSSKIADMKSVPRRFMTWTIGSRAWRWRFRRPWMLSWTSPSPESGLVRSQQASSLVGVSMMGSSIGRPGQQAPSYLLQWSCRLILGQSVHLNWNALPSFDHSMWQEKCFFSGQLVKEIFLCTRNCSAFFKLLFSSEVMSQLR